METKDPVKIGAIQVKAVCETFHMSKDTGYKVVIHMMPDLPNVGLERDVEQFVELFEVNSLLAEIIPYIPGFSESRLPPRRPQNLPDFGDPWYGTLRTLAIWKI